MIGVLGGGQLGRIASAGGDCPLACAFVFSILRPQLRLASLGELVCGDLQDPGLLPRFVEGLDLVTYEFENVPLNTARWLAKRVPVYPPPEALDASQIASRKNPFSTVWAFPPQLCTGFLRGPS